MTLEDELQVTRTVFRVGDFLSWSRHGSLDLRPPFQRGNVWSKKAKSYLIDTVLKGYPVPLIILQDQTDPETLEPVRRVVDGQQRLRTVLSFIDLAVIDDPEDVDDFTISRAHNRELAGRRFDELSDEYRMRILNYQFSVDILPVDTTSQVLLEIFARLNRTGAKLNDQEIRNATYSGEFKQMVYELSYEQLERWLGWSVFNQRQIAQMRDAELMSELVILTMSGLGGKSQSAIEKHYKEGEEQFDHTSEVIRRVEHVFDKLDETFRGDLNELYGYELEDSPFRTQGWFYVLFAVIHDRMYPGPVPSTKRPRSISAEKLRSHLSDKLTLLSAGDLDPELLKSLRGAATDSGSRRVRYEFLRQGLG